MKRVLNRYTGEFDMVNSNEILPFAEIVTALVPYTTVTMMEFKTATLSNKVPVYLEKSAIFAFAVPDSRKYIVPAQYSRTILRNYLHNTSSGLKPIPNKVFACLADGQQYIFNGQVLGNVKSMITPLPDVQYVNNLTVAICPVNLTSEVVFIDTLVSAATGEVAQGCMFAYKPKTSELKPYAKTEVFVKLYEVDTETSSGCRISYMAMAGVFTQVYGGNFSTPIISENVIYKYVFEEIYSSEGGRILLINKVAEYSHDGMPEPTLVPVEPTPTT